MRLPVLLIALTLLAACSSRPQPAPLRLQAVSPSGELLAPPTADSDRFRQALLDWFRRTDSNGDGRLDRAEFVADADRSFAAFDSDGNGLVTSVELGRMRMESPHRPSPAATGRTRRGDLAVAADGLEAASPESDRRASSRISADPVMSADTNADFRVTQAEMRAQAERRFTLFDENGDGLLTADEFVDRQMRLLRSLRGH